MEREDVQKEGKKRDPFRSNSGLGKPRKVHRNPRAFISVFTAVLINIISTN